MASISFKQTIEITLAYLIYLGIIQSTQFIAHYLKHYIKVTIMKISATVFNKGSTRINVKANVKEFEALSHALYIVKINQNTEGEPLANKQSVQAYKALKELFNTLGIEA